MKIDTINLGNQTIHSMKRIPILKNLFDDKAYTDMLLVHIFAILGLLQKLCKLIAFNFIITLVLLFIPSMIRSIFKVSLYTGFMFIIPLLVLFTTKTFKATESKYNVVYLLKMNAKSYCIIDMIKYLLFNVVILLMPLYVSIIGEGWSVYFEQFWLFLGYYVVSYIGINLLLLFFYSKTDIVLLDANHLFFPIIGCLIGIPVLFGIFHISLHFISILLVMGIFLFLIVLLSIWFVKSESVTRLYKRKFSTYSNIIDEKTNYVGNLSRQMRMDTRGSYSYEKYEGYDYFNKIFMRRHRSALYEKAFLFSGILLLLSLAFVVASLFEVEVKKFVGDILSNHYVWFLYIAMILNPGSSITQAMYYHADMAMLRYNFYRKGQVCLEMFRRRLVSIVQITFLPIGVLALCFMVMYGMFVRVDGCNIFFGGLGILLMGVFYSIFYLGLYYLLQPYTKDMKNRSVFYSFVIVFMLWITMAVVGEMSVDIRVFVVLFGCLTWGYYLLMSWLVKRFGPKTFRIK